MPLKRPYWRKLLSRSLGILIMLIAIAAIVCVVYDYIRKQG